MGDKSFDSIQSAESVLHCADLDATLLFFTERLGFRVEAIIPADDPAEAVLSAYGLRLRLCRGEDDPNSSLRLYCEDPREFGGGDLIAPNGTRVQLLASNPPPHLPTLHASLSISKLEDATWQSGRAGMLYRDLIPGRQGGRFIASHIHIPDGGDVPDYVHFHKICFQVIFCYQGWVRVVYEDQGPEFILKAGDCVLQPPQIRHRVLESSAGLQVVELSCPAEHETWADHEVNLPTAQIRSDREFDGQLFVRHQAESSAWQNTDMLGFEARDSGIHGATRGILDVQTLRPTSKNSQVELRQDREFCFYFVLHGELQLNVDGCAALLLEQGDAAAIPPAARYELSTNTKDLRLLRVVAHTEA